MSGNRDGFAAELPRQRSKVMEMLKSMPSPAESKAEAKQPEPQPALVVTPEPEIQPSGDELSPLPRAGDAYTAAYARPSNKMLPMLRLVMPNGDVRGFSFGNLDSTDFVGGEPGKAPFIVLRFAGMANIEVRIMGRHLTSLSDYLAYHRIAWVRALPAGKIVSDNGNPVVTQIVIHRVKDWPDP